LTVSYRSLVMKKLQGKRVLGGNRCRSDDVISAVKAGAMCPVRGTLEKRNYLLKGDGKKEVCRDNSTKLKVEPGRKKKPRCGSEEVNGTGRALLRTRTGSNTVNLLHGISARLFSGRGGGWGKKKGKAPCGPVKPLQG